GDLRVGGVQRLPAGNGRGCSAMDPRRGHDRRIGLETEAAGGSPPETRTGAEVGRAFQPDDPTASGWKARPTGNERSISPDPRTDTEDPRGSAPAGDPGPRRARPVARRGLPADRGPRPPRRLPPRGLGLL